VFWHNAVRRYSEQMAVKLGMLMQDQLLIPKIFKSHFGQKFELLCFGFVSMPSEFLPPSCIGKTVINVCRCDSA